MLGKELLRAHSMSLIAELQRRNVFRVALLYAALAWLVLELGTLAVEFLGLPGWVHRFVTALLVICFPLALVFSWIYEITPEGLKREFEVQRENSITPRTGRRIGRLTLAVVILIAVINLARLLFG